MKIRKFISEFSAKSNVSDCSYSYIGVLKILVFQNYSSYRAALPYTIVLALPFSLPPEISLQSLDYDYCSRFLAASNQPGYSAFYHNPFW